MPHGPETRGFAQSIAISHKCHPNTCPKWVGATCGTPPYCMIIISSHNYDNTDNNNNNTINRKEVLTTEETDAKENALC